MSFGSWIAGRFGLTEARPWTAFYGGESAAGEPVTPETALRLAAFWACVRLNAQAVATMPLQLFERDARGGRNPVDHPLADIITRSPNDQLTAMEFWEAITAWLFVVGNAYAEIVREGERIIALNLFPADQVQVLRRQDGELYYRVADRGKQYDLPPEKMFHVRGFGFGGDVGLSPLRYGVQTIGSALAADNTAAKLLGNGLMPSGILTTDQEVDDEQRTQLTDIMKKYVGSRNAGKMMVLESGMKFEQLSLDPQTMQMLETRRLNCELICMFCGTPPIIVGFAAQGMTAWGTGIESLLIQWLTTGLNPVLKRIEHRINKQLLGPSDRRRIYAEFNREALLQADSDAKIKFLSGAVQNGLMSRNEGRAKLNLPAVEGGDALTAQTNLAPLDMLGATDPRAAMRNVLGIEDPA